MAATEEACMNDTARFVLSHGATFFCPHTWDVKLLAQIVEDDARATLCKSFFSAVANGESPKHAFRPTLPQGGLPAEALAGSADDVAIAGHILGPQLWTRQQCGAR